MTAASEKPVEFRKQILLFDFLRHDFRPRELRMLVFIMLNSDSSGIARFARKRFEDVGVRDDKALAHLRDLQRARALKPGWENDEYVINPDCDDWKREEFGVRDQQFVLLLASQDSGIQFEQALAKEKFDALGAVTGVLPATVADGVFPSRVSPKLGERSAAEASPQIGGSAAGAVPAALGANPPKLGEEISKRYVRTERTQGELLARVEKCVGPDDWARFSDRWPKESAGFPDHLHRSLCCVETAIEGGWNGSAGRFLWKTFKRFMANPTLEQALAICATRGIDPEIAKTWWYERDAGNWMTKFGPMADGKWESDLIAYFRRWQAGVHERQMRYDKSKNENNRKYGNRPDPNRGFAAGAKEHCAAGLAAYLAQNE